MKKVLILAYDFPPYVSVGGLRPYSWYKYIADVFFKSGYIEAWGRGIEKIMSGFKRESLPTPLIEEIAGGVQITMYNHINSKQSKNDTINERQRVIIELININKPLLSH
ncbi:MAG: hypothetical protein PF487_10325 [Bacteroidales bacterium]|jgi:predicted HTH transcriptional regulator|nr:hypothetical protein [Bacteroidales bacterium]